MIGMLTGVIVNTNRSPIIVDVNGVGYQLSVPQRLLAELAPGKPHTLYIHTHVQDDAIDLYGFLAERELSLFKLLIGVSGIGPKTALSVLDRGVEPVEKAVSESDVEFFTTVPRLGKKNAQKIIIELKSKLGSLKELDLTESAGGETKELLEALLSMGFAKSEALDAIRRLPSKDMTIEQKIREALRVLGS